MTSATAGKPTVAPLTTLEDRTLRTHGRPIHIGVGRACARQPTKNEADLRLARCSLPQRFTGRAGHGTDGGEKGTSGRNNVVSIRYHHVRAIDDLGRSKRLSLAIDHSPVILV